MMWSIENMTGNKISSNKQHQTSILNTIYMNMFTYKYTSAFGIHLCSVVHIEMLYVAC